MPEPPALIFQRLDQRGMGVAEGADGDAGAEVEIALAAFLDQPGALALHEGERRPRIGRQNRRDHGTTLHGDGTTSETPGATHGVTGQAVLLPQGGLQVNLEPRIGTPPSLANANPCPKKCVRGRTGCKVLISKQLKC